jgi:Cft2 family RNA processing exonuclease
MKNYNVLASGSGGNATLVGSGIMIDCGVPYKTVDPFVRDIRLVLLTHV